MSQGNVQLEVFPPDGSTIPRTRENHLTKILEDLKGTVRYSTAGTGDVHICISIAEIPGRKYPRPTMVGLRVAETIEDEKTVLSNVKGQEAARRHLSDMEKMLGQMIKETNMILKNADMIKDDEVKFYQKSAEMNSSSRWWPMMHVIVLLVTGFTQANHVIKFFKSRHII